MKAMKRQKTSPNDVEVLPVFEFRTGSEAAKKLVGKQLLDFCYMTGTSKVVGRDLGFPEGHPRHEYVMNVDIKKLERAVGMVFDTGNLEQVVAKEKRIQAEKKAEDEAKFRKKNPKEAYKKDSLRHEMEDGAKEAHKEDYEVINHPKRK